MASHFDKEPSIIPSTTRTDSVSSKQCSTKGKRQRSSTGATTNRRLSEEQANMLEQYFLEDPTLETKRKERLAKELGLSPRRVVIWFQNRRVRCRTKKLEDELAKLRAYHETTVIEKCNLEMEILMLREQLRAAENEIQKLSACLCTNSSGALEDLWLQGRFGCDDNFDLGLPWDLLSWM